MNETHTDTGRCLACGWASGGDTYCNHCVNALSLDLWETNLDYRQDYSFRVPSGVPLAQHFELALGVELEYESGNPAAVPAIVQALNRDINFACVKYDGSLRTSFCGEIVTVPASLAVHRERWARLFALHPQKALGIISARMTCGLHVHVGRDRLSSGQIARTLVFINHPLNKRFLRRIAGRTSRRWARFEPKTLGDAQKPQSQFSRYQALNLTPQHTIEFRLFQGTLNQTLFFGRVEFVHALLSYYAPCRLSFSASYDWRSFIKWVADKRKDYPNLTAMLDELRVMRAWRARRERKPAACPVVSLAQQEAIQQPLLTGGGLPACA